MVTFVPLYFFSLFSFQTILNWIGCFKNIFSISWKICFLLFVFYISIRRTMLPLKYVKYQGQYRIHTKILLSITSWTCNVVHQVLLVLYLTAVFICILDFLVGAFVAGLNAVFLYNSFPKMTERCIPQKIATFYPYWKNIFQNATTALFNYRLLVRMVLKFTISAKLKVKIQSLLGILQLVLKICKYFLKKFVLEWFWGISFVFLPS